MSIENLDNSAQSLDKMSKDVSERIERLRTFALQDDELLDNFFFGGRMNALKDRFSSDFDDEDMQRIPQWHRLIGSTFSNERFGHPEEVETEKRQKILTIISEYLTEFEEEWNVGN